MPDSLRYIARLLFLRYIAQTPSFPRLGISLSQGSDSRSQESDSRLPSAGLPAILEPRRLHYNL